MLLQGIAAMVRVFDWPEAENKGDAAADHPAVTSGSDKAVGWLLDDLSGAPERGASEYDPEPEKPANRLLAGRVDMQRVIEHGIEPPEELENGLMLRGLIHQLFGPSESGKTMVTLLLIKCRLEAGESVIFFDAENGPRTMGERLQRMGLDPKHAANLYYLPFPDLTVSADSRRDFENLLDEIVPTLIVFDSWASFLSAAGFSENENAEIEHWDSALTKQAKQRGIASLIVLPRASEN